MPASHEFAADGRTETEISKLIGADRLFYQDLDDLITAVKDKSSHVTKFDSSCFDGNYVTGNVSKEYLKELDDLRNDAAKIKDSIDSHDDVMVY
jgi:amidophosphoribosyltransferase